MLKIALAASILLIVLCTLQKPANAMEHYNKLWSVNTLIGPLSDNTKLKYFVEQHTRFTDINDRYRFNQFLFLPGIGYQLNQNIIVFSGIGWIYFKGNTGRVDREFRIWQQMYWQIRKTDTQTVDSRTRLEERKNSDVSSITTRFRERLWVRIPLKDWSFFLSVFDEVLFNLNRPQGLQTKFFDQNRAFIGFGSKLTPFCILDLGYLSQYVSTTEKQLNHVFLLSLIVTL